MEKIRLGLIGLGNMGTPVAQMLTDGRCPEIRLAAICDSSAKRLEYARAEYPDTPLFLNAEEMMDSGLVDMVYIAVPHYDHPVLAKEAFRRKLHVMVEKPAGVYTKAVREMNEEAEKAGVKFGMMFQSRTIDAFRKVKELLDSGEFGQIRSISWLVTNWYRSQAYYDSGSWRATWAGEGGGVLLNQCPHNLDLLQWLGGMPVEITAKCSVAKWHDIEVEDDVAAILRYENGALGTFITSTGIAPGTNRLEIATDKGTMIVENSAKLTVRSLQARLLPGQSDQTAPKVTTIEYTFPKETMMRHGLVFNAFAGAILRDEPMVAPGEEGIRSLTLSNAMYLSAWTGETVQLPLDEELFCQELQKRVATSKHKEVETVYADATSMYQDRK